MSDHTVLVTGGAGFIGAHLIDELIANGRKVTVVDDLSTGSRTNVHPDAELRVMDVCDPDIDRIVAETEPSMVFHLAAQISVSRSTREPLLDARINILGSLNLMNALRKHGAPRMVFASTGGAIYGEPERLPVAESDPCRPISPYAASKLAVEQYLETFRASYGFDYSIVRLGNIYGPRQDPHGEAGVVAIFARAMLASETIRIFGDGTDERDYVYVSDAVGAMMRVSEAGRPTAYNVGTGVGTSVNSLAEELSRLTGFTGKKLHAEPREGDLHKVTLDAGKLARNLGWRPKVSLTEGLERTVEFFRTETLREP